VQGGTWSTRQIETTLSALRRAIRNEIAGQRFYQDAAGYCIDPWAKEIFSVLADEEEDHTRLLLLEYEALATQGQWIELEIARASDADVDITRVDFRDDVPAEELFPPQWSVEQAVDRRGDDLTALAFGVAMEDKAIALYTEAAATTGDLATHQTYRFLVEEETRHYRQLKEQWEQLAGIPFDDRGAVTDS
jgi:rubrerythrin